MDTHSGISTAPLVIRKVDKGKIVTDDGGPVSQMQKIALQRINQDGTRHYLSAAGPMPGAAGTMSPAPGQAKIRFEEHHASKYALRLKSWSDRTGNRYT